MTFPNDSTAVVATTPPLAVATANSFGLTLPDMVQLATLFYLALLILHKGWHMWRDWQNRRNHRAFTDNSSDQTDKDEA